MKGVSLCIQAFKLKLEKTPEVRKENSIPVCDFHGAKTILSEFKSCVLTPYFIKRQFIQSLKSLKRGVAFVIDAAE